MEKLIILSPGKVTATNLAAQCSEIFGEYIKVVPYSFSDNLDFDIESSLVILSSPQVINEKVQDLIDKGLNYIVGRRAINYRYLVELLELPKASKVLFVNDRKETTYQVIEQLNTLGVNNITYYPYFPGINSYPKLDIAVTVGEAHLVPYEVKKIIDLKTRRLDIITLVDIARRLELVEILGNNISSQYLNEIMGLLNQINDDGKEMKIISSRLDTVANCLPKAILYVNKDGEIIVSNQYMYDLLGLSSKDIIGRNIESILPELAIDDDNEWSQIIMVGNESLFVTVNVIKDRCSEDGFIYIFEKSEEIEKNEHKIRRLTTRNAITKNYYTFKDIVHESKSMEKLIGKAKIFANTDSTILIQGESGTGKELFAQSIHKASNRSSESFVPVNFAAMVDNLMESELFGYEGGSFTGAIRNGKRGLFEEAHGGTIFLDEIGDASLEFQCSLLRVIQERHIRRVGGIKEIPIDVRIIAATNKDLVQEISKGNFRADLYYRLNVLPLKMPSLRERKTDILILANHFLKIHSKGKINNIKQIIEKDAIKLIYDYDWPGNIRQLENAMEYLAIIWGGKGGKLDIRHLPEYITNNSIGPNKSLIQEILGKEMIWVLNKVMDSNGCGRRYLSELAEKENMEISEGQIRSLLNNAKSLELVESSVGRNGTVLTEKGRIVLSFVQTNGLSF
jgi:PAS domain S-box-containing protein